MDERERRQPTISLGDLIRFLMVTLVKWSQTGAFGDITIRVRHGQIAEVDEGQTFRGGLPARRSIGGDNAVEAAADRVAKEADGVAPLRLAR